MARNQSNVGGAGKYLLSNGRGAVLDDKDVMAKEQFLVVSDLSDATGLSRDATIRQAMPIGRGVVEKLFKDALVDQNICHWSKRDAAVLTRTQTCLGPLVLSDKNWVDCPDEDIAAALIDGMRSLGAHTLPWSKPARFLAGRIEFLRDAGSDMPDASEEGILDQAEDWLLPYIGGIKTVAGLKQLDLPALIKGMLTWEQQSELDRLAPASIKAPTGTTLPVDYSGEQPSVAVRLQEMFGLTVHPTVGPKRLPLRIDLLSPAQKTVQSTSDLPRFWKTSYADVRKDMRGRYPRHPWPEDPSVADPTRRVKPRGT
jgi:ATP-dependent helicase HrpB